jgi:hypothetical protein
MRDLAYSSPGIFYSHLPLAGNNVESGLSQVQGVHEMSTRHVQEALWRVLVASDSSLSPITSDHLLT